MMGNSTRWFRPSRNRRMTVVAALLFAVLLGLTHAADWFLVSRLERMGEAAAEKKGAELVAAAVREFGQLQRSARRIGVETGQHPEVLRYLSGGGTDSQPLFAAAAHAAEVSSAGIEIYDAEAELVAWAGPGGTGGRREVRIALDGQMISLVSHSAVSSQLSVAVPVRHELRILGVIVVRQTIEVVSPLRNRFLGQEGLTERVSRELGANVRYVYAPEEFRTDDSSWVRAPLYGIDSTQVGTVGIQRLPPAALAGRYGEISGRIAAAFECLLLIAVMAMGWHVVPGRASGLVRILGRAVVLWSGRVVLLLLDAPGRLVGGDLFGPVAYASTFGGGLARSVGELTITVGFFCLTLWLVYRNVPRVVPDRPLGRSGTILRTAGAAAVVMLLYLLLRAYGAAVRSILFDSSLTIGDPAILLPPLPMALLLLDVIALGWGLALVAVVSMSALLRVLGGHAPVTLAGLLAAAAIAAGHVQAEPLTTLLYRLAFGGGVLAVVWGFAEPRGDAPRRKSSSLIPAVTALSALLLLPLIDQFVAERDRAKIETFAGEVLRPIDGWLKFIVEEGMLQMGGPAGGGDVHQAGGRYPSSAALQAWARSAACREGYSSIFELLDAEGREVSRFAIGGQAAVAQQVANSLPLDTAGVIRMKSIGDGVSAVRVYGGTAPLWDERGEYAGHVRVTVAAGEQQLFRGDNPAVLRGTSRETLESFYRPVTIAEYRDGLLLRSTNADFPFTHVLPAALREELASLRPPMKWVEETIGGISYETFYALRGVEGRDVIGLSLERRSPLMRLVAIVKVGTIALLIAAALFGTLAMLRYLSGRRYQPTFRDRLLAAMLLTSLLPLVVLLVYSQWDVRERLLETMAVRLQDQTATIAHDIAGIGEHADASAELELRADRVELIASNAGTDFNLYVDNALRISSRPELYAAGLLDARISGEAYAHVVLGGKRFHVETENIGLFRYAVGYRPVLDAAGGIIGIVSVPTLFRQDALERDMIERNAVLFGIYAVVVIAILVLLSLLAHRFATPVLELTALVRDVGRGNLNISGRLPHADGEIGELVHTFNDMTQELQRSRDELVRVERELAWKEMARQVAHEIKNPLTPVRLSIQHLRRAYLDGAPAFGQILEQVTRTVLEQIDALSRIASEFSNFARMPRRRLEAVAVPDIVREAVALFAQETRVAFQVTAPDRVPMLQADREELRRAFINILRNSVQAMNGQGSVQVTITLEENSLTMLFRDTGPGIPDDVKPKLFQPNFSTKTDGMGLGLAIVKKTITDLGGNVWIESQVGAGTTVGVQLPVSAEAGEGE